MKALRSWLASPTASTDVGTLTDLSVHIERLLEAREGAFLIVEVNGQSENFLQLTAAPDGIQIDHPFITPAQISREGALRAIYAEVGLTPYVTRGSDGSQFLDCDVPRDARAAGRIVHRLFEGLFGADSSTEIRFIENHLAPRG